jgi:hypothetical protein
MMDDKEHQWHDFPEIPSLTVLPWLGWALILGLILAGVLYASKAVAEPKFQAKDKEAVITLWSDPCEVKEVQNLPFKATWVEGAKTFTGCWGPRPDVGAVLFYFKEDGSVGIAPIQAFKPVVGA